MEEMIAGVLVVRTHPVAVRHYAQGKPRRPLAMYDPEYLRRFEHECGSPTRKTLKSGTLGMHSVSDAHQPANEDAMACKPILKHYGVRGRTCERWRLGRVESSAHLRVSQDRQVRVELGHSTEHALSSRSREAQRCPVDPSKNVSLSCATSNVWRLFAILLGQSLNAGSTLSINPSKLTSPCCIQVRHGRIDISTKCVMILYRVWSDRRADIARESLSWSR